jgi:cob(I)alamin adenosyltransferase
MKTTIEYSVELKDVPAKVKEKVIETAAELEKLNHYVHSIAEDLEQEPINIIIQRIDRFRQRLFQVDTMMADCGKAIKGYNDVIIELQEQRAKEAAANVPPPTSVEHD